MTIKILVAENENHTRRQLVSWLEHKGLQAVRTGNFEGLKGLLGQAFDLMIVDVQILKDSMDEFSGRLTALGIEAPIIFLGAREDFYKIQYGGIVENLPLPFTFEELEGSFSRLLGDGAALGEPSDYYELDELPSGSRHPGMKKAVGLIGNVAEGEVTVLISGESGVGKECFARALHGLSRRRRNTLIAINCASVPATLLETELFGCERGAYTGASARRLGKFEMAQNGTLLLDEVSEIDLSVQSKLLRVIQEKELYRVGGHDKVSLDVRLVATTNRDLKAWVAQGSFREDLYYRLNVIAIHVPPLRERPEDIPVLAEHFIRHFNRENPERHLSLTLQASQELTQYAWPGNIRELENILLRTAYLTRDDHIKKIYFDEHHGMVQEGSPASTIMTLDEMERRMIAQALEITEGNRVRAAQNLGISVRTLRNKLRQYREEAKAAVDDSGAQVEGAVMENYEDGSLVT